MSDAAKEISKLQNVINALSFELIQTNQDLMALYLQLGQAMGQELTNDHNCKQIASRIGRVRSLTFKKP